MSCRLCNSKGTVTVLEDDLRLNWPCPKCRIRKFTMEFPFTDHDLANWKNDGLPLEVYLSRQLRQRIGKELAESITDIEHRINGIYHVLYAELDVIIPI